MGPAVPFDYMHSVVERKSVGWPSTCDVAAEDQKIAIEQN